MTITVSVPDWGMTYNLSFEHGDILLAPVADGTHVTWRMRGEVGMNPMAKYFAVLMDYRIGADFEQSLTNLKRKLETKG